MKNFVVFLASAIIKVEAFTQPNAHDRNVDLAFSGDSMLTGSHIPIPFPDFVTRDSNFIKDPEFTVDMHYDINKHLETLLETYSEKNGWNILEDSTAEGNGKKSGTLVAEKKCENGVMKKVQLKWNSDENGGVSLTKQMVSASSC